MGDIKTKIFKCHERTYHYIPIEGKEPTITTIDLHFTLHRVDGPAYDNGYGNTKWLQHGILHREDGPAIVSHYSYKILQEWFIWGKRTAGENIPTIVHLDQETKKVIKEEYLIDGSLHRTNGPAYLDIVNGVGGFFVDDRDVTNNALKYCNHHGIDPLNMDEGDKALMHLGLEKWGY